MKESMIILTSLHQARHILRMQTGGPINVVVDQGAVFDYFDGIRKIIEIAKQDFFSSISILTQNL